MFHQPRRLDEVQSFFPPDKSECRSLAFQRFDAARSAQGLNVFRKTGHRRLHYTWCCVVPSQTFMRNQKEKETSINRTSFFGRRLTPTAGYSSNKAAANCFASNGCKSSGCSPTPM